MYIEYTATVYTSIVEQKGKMQMYIVYTATVYTLLQFRMGR